MGLILAIHFHLEVEADSLTVNLIIHFKDKNLTT